MTGCGDTTGESARDTSRAIASIMCLIVFAWRQHPDYPLILAANRDEYHARPADAMGWWQDRPDVLGGRDLEAGGTWLAIAKHGRFATVTNYRDKVATEAARSRGDIVTRFVVGRDSPHRFAKALDGELYAGFSALVADRDALVYHSNRDDATARLGPGVFGLSNAALDTPWPKLVRCRNALDAAIADGRVSLDTLFDILADREPAAAEEVAAVDLPFEMARAISAPFIVTPDYGTRCSTALVWRADDHVEIAERRFDAAGELAGESRFVFLVG